MDIPTKPTWKNLAESDRSEHTALRHRMLCGTWYQDLIDAMNMHVSLERQEAWGNPDMSSNIFKETTKALCALYLKPPVVTNPRAQEGQTQGFLGNEGVLSQAGLWGLMKRVQFFTIGLRECFLRIDYTEETNRISYRIVTPDMVSAAGALNDAQTPVCIKEMRLRKNPQTEMLEWTIDFLDISDESNPIYRVYRIGANEEDKREDMSELYLGGDLSGANYPYIDSEGRPFLPYSLYHAELTGDLFDPYYNSELLQGSLSASCLYTFFIHMMRDCAWPQRWMYNAVMSSLIGGNGQDAQVASVETDPASILCFLPAAESGEGAIQAQFGQWQAGGDVEKTLEAITTFERRLATLAGISGADVHKMSGDPRSGYAISISRSSLREAQSQYSPSFRRADLNTVTVTAKMLNAFTGSSYPESGYQIDYYELPKSPEELKAERDHRNDLIDRGLLSNIMAVMEMYPDYDRENAIEYLNQVRRDNALTMI